MNAPVRSLMGRQPTTPTSWGVGSDACCFRSSGETAAAAADRVGAAAGRGVVAVRPGPGGPATAGPSSGACHQPADRHGRRREHRPAPADTGRTGSSASTAPGSRACHGRPAFRLARGPDGDRRGQWCPAPSAAPSPTSSARRPVSRSAPPTGALVGTRLGPAGRGGWLIGRVVPLAVSPSVSVSVGGASENRTGVSR